MGLLLHRQGLLQSAAGGAFDPLSLFSGSEEGALYDKFDPADGYLYQDSALTTLCTAAGDPVGGIVDRSGNGNDALQPTNNDFRPTLQQDGSGNWYLDFDGVDDRLILGTFAFPTNFTYCLAYDTDGDAAGIFLDRSAGTNRWAFIHDSGSSSTAIFDAGYSGLELYVDDVLTATSTRGAVHTAIAGNHIDVWDVSTTLPSDNWAIGDYGGAFSLAGNVYGLVWREELSAGERSDLTAYLANLSGVTLP